MAKKKRKKKSHGKRPAPTLKAKKAYYKLIANSCRRTYAVLKKHNPAALPS